ncbi:unnamed protein product [Trichogramma brassicae]|uniref:Reverse transcriptase zinc-binding domain-containing protein n=1 Tax=Trichogramma brassicae TaxID=86971 RepID=A0A6H5IJU8_9HYME|nr:unnamed protein product [Trichogramma brassicae]
MYESMLSRLALEHHAADAESVARPIECRAGCGTTETAAHVIQGCHRTHGGRILRHDAICRIAVSSLRQLGWSVRQEPHFHTREGLRKPDVVAVKDQVVRCSMRKSSALHRPLTTRTAEK